MKASVTMSKLRTCPDCGGILQRTDPERVPAAEFGLPVEGPHETPLAWQRPLCGYREDGAVESPAAPSLA